MSSYIGGRRRAVSRQTAEEQVLDRISRDVSRVVLFFSNNNFIVPNVYARMQFLQKTIS